MVATAESVVGKFRMQVSESTDAVSNPQDRIDAIAAWLFRQWQQEQVRTADE